MSPKPLALICFASLAALGCSSAPAPRKTPEGPTLRVVTYNVNYGVAGDAETLEAIGADGADVVALQETTPEWEALIRAAYDGRYPHIAFHHSRGAGGLALLSKWPFSAKIIANPGEWFPAMYAVLDTPHGRIQLLNLHLRPPVSDSGSFASGYFTTGSYRLEEARAFGREIGPVLPLLVLGDFNESAGKALEFFARLNAKDAVAERAGDSPTWRWPIAGFAATSQLDHILYRSPLALVDLEIRQTGNSDHLPIVADFALEPSRVALDSSRRSD